MAEKYWWQKDEQQNSGQQSNDQQSGGQGYWWQNGSVATTVANNVNSRVSTWFKNYDTYVKNYQSRYAGRKYSYEDSYVNDSASWLETVRKQKGNFDAEANSILSYMEKYKDYLDPEWAENVRQSLIGATKTNGQIVSSASQDHNYWSNWATEDEYKTSQRYDVYNKKYSGQSYDAIQQALNTIEDGEEKNWLVNNQYELYKNDRNYMSRAASGYKSFQAQHIAELEAEKNKPWYENVIEDFGRTSDTNLLAATFANVVSDYRNDTSYREPNDEWSLEEKNHFGYLWEKDKEKAYAYAEQVNNQINAEKQYAQQLNVQENATKSGWSMVGNTLGAIATAPTALADYLDNLAEYAGRGTITNKGMLTPFDYSQAAQSGIANELNGVDENGVARKVIDDDVFIFGGKGWGDVYSLGVSAANSMLSAYALGGAGTLVNFIGQGGAAGVDEALSRGATAEQALLYGTIVGAAEGVTEMINADRLIKVGSSATLKNYLLKALSQGLGETVEEGASSIIGNIADEIIMKDKSNFYSTVKELMEADPNLTEEEAKKKAWTKMVGDVVFDAMGGFVTGGANAMTVGGISTAVDSSKFNPENKKALEKHGGEKQTALIQESFTREKGTEARALAEKYQKQADKGKNLTGFQIRNLLAANQEHITAEDMRKIENAATKRLTALGQTEDVAKIAELATKYATGGKLTRAEKSFLANSKYGSRVANELLPENIEAGSHAAEWAEDIQTRSVNYEAYNKKKIQTRAAIEAMVKKALETGEYKSIEDRAGEDKYGVAESGQATIRETGEAIDLGDGLEIGTIQDGKMTVKTADGKEIPADAIDYATAEQAHAFSVVPKIENITPGDAAVMLKTLDYSKPIGAQLNAMDESYTYGFRNYSVEDLKAGKFVGDITEEQMMSAYELGKAARKYSRDSKVDAFERMRTAADAIAEKNAAEGKEAPKAKKMTITYNDKGKIVDFDKAGLKNLSTEQRAAPVFAEVMHEMGLGSNFELYASYLNAEGKRVYINENGVEDDAPAGLYRKSDGTVCIDLNAYNGKELTLDSMAHELTHFIQKWSDTKYQILADFLIKTYEKTDMTMHERVIREQARLERIRKKAVSYDEAFDEVVANAMSKMLADGKVMEKLAELKAQDADLANKLWARLKKLLNKFFRTYEKYPALFDDAGDLMALKAEFEQMKNMWAEAFVEASENYQASLITKEAGLEFVPVEDGTLYSYSSLAEAAGFTAVMNEDGTRSFTRDGEKVSKVTIEDIDNSPIGAFINFSVEMKDISEAEAKRQKEMFAKLCTIACKTNDFAMTMQFVGSAVFTGMKANADKQYGTTYDFPSICTKTQAVIDAMSAKMVSLGRGLTADEIVQLYADVFASGNPVPCPECYVFSRWIGIGGLLDNIKKYQDYYGDMAVEDVAEAYRKMKAEVSKFAEEQGISFGKAKGALTSKLTKEFNKLTEKVEKQQNQGEKVKPADLKRLEELEPMMNTVKAMTWLENVYFADSSLKKVNPKFRVPNNVLFNLNNGEAFASQYKDAWAFRTTQGAGYGKAITPYAEARLGEGVLVTNNTTNAIKGRAQGSLDNYFLSQMGKLDKKSREALKRARTKQKIQSFLGGQRFQSTSDARYENASDYLLAALEMQAMGGMAQCYTKVDGAVPAFSAWGFSINQSLMPLNGGLDENGNVKDTPVGGMKPSVAFNNRKNHESAGTITIGVNDNHIRAMFKQLVRDFIIPYHASGGKADVVAEFRRIQEGKEAKGEAVRSTDYSRTQSDKVLSDEVLRWQGKTDAQIQRIHEVRNARIAILTGGKPNMTVVRSNRFLSALYDKFNGGEWDGVKVAKSKVESQIFPNEFWDQTVTYEESAKITKDYLEYCEDLGFLHRFSGTVPSNGRLVPVKGYNENGERIQLTDLAYKYDENGNKTAEVEEFFWKVLTDRRMYDNNGNYLPQKVVTLNDTTADTVTDFAKHNQGRQYDKAKAEVLAKKIVKGDMYSSQETDADSISVNDVVAMGNGRLAVNINSEASGLHGHRKYRWPAMISEMIRNTLAGKSIIAEDGDIITVTRRGANEVGFGTDTIRLKTEARAANDYSKVEQKMITAEHAASIIALSRYSSWSENTEDPSDMFKRDGLNYRKVDLFIDGEPYVATVVTALNVDPSQVEDYGDKFYDIESIEKKTNLSAPYGTPNMGAVPHKINMAESSSDKLTIAQKKRVVNRGNATYSTGTTGVRTAMEEAFSRAKELKSSQETDLDSHRSLLANAFEGLSQNSEEYKLIQEYKGLIKLLNEQEEKLSELNAEIRKLTFGTDTAREPQRLKKLQADAKKAKEAINRHDKRLLSLEAMEPLRKVLEMERKKASQKAKAHVKEIQQNKKLRAEQTELRHKIRKAVRDLDKILKHGNKQKNVKEDLQGVVTKALQAADILFTENYGNYDMLRNGIGADMSDAEEALVATCAKMLKELDKMPTDGYDNFKARQEAENRLKTKMSKLKEVFARERKRLNNTTVSSILGELADAYKSLEKSEQSYVQGAYIESVHSFLENLKTEVGGTVVQDMTKEQLESVYAAYKMVLTTVRKANQLFNQDIKMSREQLGNAVIEEVLKAGGVHGLWSKAEIAASQADWNNMKPVWVANRIGSESFAKLMQGLFDGQYKFAEDIDEAKQFKLSMDKKYHPRSWDTKKQHEFESSTGRKFSLDLQQIMSLYAFSKREQAYSHLLNGGFVFENNSTVVVDGKLGIKKTYIHKGATSYKLNEATLNEIINTLTAEQKAYVDEMQKYLSEVMGSKGNEVSMQLYGIQMFKEQFYFPLRSSGAYMERAKEAEMKKEQGQINLVNSGFTHSVKPEAKNPIILSGFMDVWAEHCNEMSMYHAMVLPMEDFRKVYNYSTVHDDKVDSASVFQTIQDAYGYAATSYLDQLYRELNAGATVDPRETPFKKFISRFKKAAVMLSGSVVVQQFSSIGRAYALIDPKYFVGKKVNSGTQMSVVDEMKKYAPVAIIKEMGGFDTGTKGSAKSYIMAEKYGKGERLKGFRTDEQYRGDLMGYLPAKADEKTWVAIWEAVKRETAAKHSKMDVKSEEFLKLAGERFSEVIEKTQVYDSVLARSANMRSKSAFMNMATAFMAEPTTTVNLLEDAVRSGSAKKMARAFGAAAVAIVLNNALASVVYAMRDDDEDETYIEKYFQSFTSGMIDDINPMSYYPFLKDVYSLFQGYDVERTDMSVIADVRDAMKKAVSLLGKDTSEMDEDELAEHYRNVNSMLMSLLDAGCSAFGVPMKNVRRDAMGIVNAWNTISKDVSGERNTTWLSFWDKVGEAAKDTTPIYAWTKDRTKGDKLYEAIMAGDEAYVARLKGGYKTDSSYESAVRKALRENDPRVKEAAEAKFSGNFSKYKELFLEIRDEGNFDWDTIMSAVNSEINALEKKANGGAVEETTEDSSEVLFKTEDYYTAVVNNDTASAKAIRDELVAEKVADGYLVHEALDAIATGFTTQVKNAYLDGEITRSKAVSLLADNTDHDESKVKEWDFEKKHGFSWSERVRKYRLGQLSEEALITAVVDIEGEDREAAEDYIDFLDLEKANPYIDITASDATGYFDYAEPAGIDIEVYLDYKSQASQCKSDRDANGKVISGSKKEKVLAVIDSLPLTRKQKDALYQAAGYAESEKWNVPW